MPAGRPAKLAILKEMDADIRMIEDMPQETPDCPDWLSGEAKAEWERIVPQVAARRMLSAVDAATLAAYCTTYARWKKVAGILEEEGLTFTNSRGDVQAHPMTRHEISLLAELRKIGDTFGFNPHSRQRIKAPAKRNEEDEEFTRFAANAE